MSIGNNLLDSNAWTGLTQVYLLIFNSTEALKQTAFRGAFHSKKSRTPLAKIILFASKIHQKSVEILLF